LLRERAILLSVISELLPPRERVLSLTLLPQVLLLVLLLPRVLVLRNVTSFDIIRHVTSSSGALAEKRAFAGSNLYLFFLFLLVF